MNRLNREYAALFQLHLIPAQSDGNFQVSDAEKSAFRLVPQTFDFPTMRKHDLLDHGQAQTRPLLIGGEIRLEYFLTAVGRHAGAVVPNFERRFRGAELPGRNVNLSVRLHRLNGVDDQVEQNLPQQLVIGLVWLIGSPPVSTRSFFSSMSWVECAHNFVDGSGSARLWSDALRGGRE